MSLNNLANNLRDNLSSKVMRLNMQWDDVISRIRMLPNFSRFLLPPLFSDLQKAADDGPVIIVNASQYSCDALIIVDAQYPVHIPRNITQAEVSKLSSEFQSLTHRGGSSDDHLEIIGVLRKLWCRIVGPVVRALTELIHSTCSKGL